MPVKILLNGSNGRMGRAISDSAAECGCEIAAACDIGSRPEDFIENCDVAVDFSFREATAALAELCAKFGKPLVIGTTGHTTEQRAKIESFSKIIPIVWAGNYSLGVNLLNHLAKIAATTLDESYDIEIVEMHHRHKKDAPSGTAKLLLDAVVEAEPEAGYHPVYGREGMCGARDPKEIGMHSLRGGTVAGVHEVSFFGQDEEVTLTHRATSRQIFVNGALAAAQKLVTREPGFYTFDQVMFA